MGKLNAEDAAKIDGIIERVEKMEQQNACHGHCHCHCACQHVWYTPQPWTYTQYPYTITVTS